MMGEDGNDKDDLGENRMAMRRDEQGKGLEQKKSASESVNDRPMSNESALETELTPECPSTEGENGFRASAGDDDAADYDGLETENCDLNGPDDPRQVGVDNTLFGDYGMKKSPSTKDFVSSYIDDEMVRNNVAGRISSAMKKKMKLPDSLLEGGSNRFSLLESPVEEQSRHDAQDSDAFKSGINENLFLKENDVHIVDQGSVRLADTKTEKLAVAREVFQVAGDVYMEAIESIVDDDFWKCFESKKPRAWNWNAYLWPLWFIGLLFRYCILFPFRLIVLAIGWIVFAIGMLFVKLFTRGKTSTGMEHKLISMMCGVFCFTWGAVIRYHGSPVEPLPGHAHPVYVANHTSMIDVVILQQMRCFSLVGQRHKGIVRFLQEVVLGCLQCIWFDRGEIKDREVVARKLKEHARDSTRNPLLVFPEGTCVNNEAVLQFKKGIFEIGVPVVPVAIKYSKVFVDPFWNSRNQSFVMHLAELMLSWCLICEVTYLQPHTRRKGETAEVFADRVKEAISRKAGIKNTNWDGYMKYWKPSKRYLHARQVVLAKSLLQIAEKCEAKNVNGLSDRVIRKRVKVVAPYESANTVH